MNSRNVLREARELKVLKELLLVYPWWQAIAIQIIRTVGYPRKWKADLHGFSLSLLPAVLAFHAGPAVLGTEDANLTFSTCLYICAVIIVLFIKGWSKDVVDDGAESLNFEVRLNALKFGFSFIVLVLFAFLPAFVSLFSDNPSDEAWAGLIGAAIIALISYKTLALSPEYLLDAKNAPPLLCDREKAVLKTAAVVYGVIVIAALPRLLPENILNIPWQVGVLFAGGAMLAGVILALFYWRCSIGAVLFALIYRLYRLYRRFK